MDACEFSENALELLEREQIDLEGSIESQSSCILTENAFAVCEESFNLCPLFSDGSVRSLVVPLPIPVPPLITTHRPSPYSTGSGTLRRTIS